MWKKISSSYPQGMCPKISDTSTMNNHYYGKCKTYATLDILWGIFLWSWCNGYWHPQIRISLNRFFLSIKTKVKGENIPKLYITGAYKLKVLNDKYDTMNFYHMRQNINAYTREEKIVVIIPVYFFKLTGTNVTLPFLIMHTSK